MSATQDKTSAFIARWQGVTASELSTAQSFVIELCDLLNVERPTPRPNSKWELMSRSTGAPTADQHAHASELRSKAFADTPSERQSIELMLDFEADIARWNHEHSRS